MTLNCIDRAQSPTHKGNLLQGRKSSLSHQQNANHSRRNSCSPPLTKTNSLGHQQQSESSCKQIHSSKLERSVSSDPGSDRKMVQNTNSSRYKTELCRPFEENGTCKYGDKCQFAHGIKELRSMARHPKYKTELCRTFHSTGLCPYGPRCHFIHNSEQTKKNLLTNLSTSSAPIIPVGIRPKALTSLGSDGELSPPSSNEGSPTDLKCFNDIFNSSPTHPLSPTLMNDVFFTEMGPAGFVYQDLLERLSDHGKSNFAPGSADYVGYLYRDDIDIDNHKCQGGSVFDFDIDNHKCQGGPVLDLYPTGPSPSPPDNYNFLKFPIFDTFQQNNFQPKIH
ncbi:mRNA decay activator protein ZFP36L1 [Parasteatoda tepidariorum]|uniref:mRNA decay activator protein ZFP36L1 n=1 Tax=Parasteatoda tepidariorum TaxID=114398 RepID=UPI00077F9885|nr:mRNA decay activator protein ZFP36L1 [Parasteatoda tepidariorum]